MRASPAGEPGGRPGTRPPSCGDAARRPRPGSAGRAPALDEQLVPRTGRPPTPPPPPAASARTARRAAAPAGGRSRSGEHGGQQPVQHVAGVERRAAELARVRGPLARPAPGPSAHTIPRVATVSAGVVRSSVPASNTIAAVGAALVGPASSDRAGCRRSLSSSPSISTRTCTGSAPASANPHATSRSGRKLPLSSDAPRAQMRPVADVGLERRGSSISSRRRPCPGRRSARRSGPWARPLGRSAGRRRPAANRRRAPTRSQVPPASRTCRCAHSAALAQRRHRCRCCDGRDPQPLGRASGWRRRGRSLRA